MGPLEAAETAERPHEAPAVATPSREAAGSGLILSQVSKAYVLRRWPRRNTPMPVLESVSLTVRPGTTAWVGGANGSGKTTLLRLACGILLPDQGSVRFDDLDPQQQRADFHRQTGFLSAGDRGIYARLSVRRHLQIWARCAFVPAADRERLVSAALTRFGLDELQDRRADRMSLGQRQRVKLAMTFLHEPRMVLLDEPNNSLDDAGLDALGQAVADHAARGGVAIWCSPPVERNVLHSDAQYVLEEGRLVAA